jgi:Rrf2 family protein
MKLFQRDTDYAIRALNYMAKAGKEWISTKELEEQIKVPRFFLRKILQILEKQGILKSLKGSLGGFQLALPPERIYLLDLMRIFQGEVTLSECLLNKKICPQIKICSLRKKIKKIEEGVIRELEGISLSSL